MATARGCWRSIRPSIRWRCSWAARIRRGWLQAARIGEDVGYDEINLNVGCPSDRVQSGRFGACLMAEPELVADCMAAIGAAVSIPVTVKCRIGVDDQDPEQALFELVDACAAAGVGVFVVHARKAWLKGLSPKQNRDVPPLDYPLVWRLKRERPALTVVINGGIGSLDEAEQHLAHVDGVMLGRAAYHTPGLLGEVDRRLFGEGADVTPEAAVAAYLPYVRARAGDGRAPGRDDAPHAGPVPRPARRAHLAAHPHRRRRQDGGWDRGDRARPGGAGRGAARSRRGLTGPASRT